MTDQLALISAPTVPWRILLLAVVGAVVGANLIALIPGRRAARVNVAEALRAG